MRSALCVFIALTVACGSPPPQRSAPGDTIADSQAIKEANAVAGEAMRVAGDCEALKAAAPEALRQLDQIGTRVRTTVGQTSLAALRKQVTDAVGVCP